MGGGRSSRRETEWSGLEERDESPGAKSRSRDRRLALFAGRGTREKVSPGATEVRECETSALPATPGEMARAASVRGRMVGGSLTAAELKSQREAWSCRSR